MATSTASLVFLATYIHEEMADQFAKYSLLRSQGKGGVQALA